MHVAIDARYLKSDGRAVRAEGGIGRYTLRVIENLLELDPELRLTLVVDAKNRGPVIAPALSRGRVREIPFAAPPHSARTLLWLARSVDLRGCDLFHAPFNVLPIGLPIPAVTTVHDVMWLRRPELCAAFGPKRWLTGSYYRAGIGRALSESALVLTVSHTSAREIEAWEPSLAGRVRVTHNGLDPFFGPLPLAEAERATASLVPAGTPYVLSVGQGSPYKNHARAVRAFCAAFRDRPDVRMVLVRRFSRWDREMREVLDAPDARGRVTILPSVTEEQLRALYVRAAIFFFPSLWEGFGIPAIEAMACGAPVVASNVDPLREVCGDAAVTADPLSIDGMAAALRRVFDDPALAASLRARGAERAAGFTWRACAEGTLSAYREALALPAAR